MSSAIALPCSAARVVMIESHRVCIARMSVGVWWSCAALGRKESPCGRGSANC
jgi:hypothetical protein